LKVSVGERDEERTRTVRKEDNIELSERKRH
jgi:hypothetical protein